MKKKKLTRDFPWKRKVSMAGLCEQSNCNKPGVYKAPKSTSSTEQYNFCLEHVRIYNKRWNFFAGKSQKEIYDYQKNELYQNKPTSPMSEQIHSKIKFDYSYVFEEKFEKFQNREKKCKENDFDEALKLFNLQLPFTVSQLKKKYNILVKKNHPDIHGGDIKKESLLKKINIYYKNLKKVAN